MSIQLELWLLLKLASRFFSFWLYLKYSGMFFYNLKEYLRSKIKLNITISSDGSEESGFIYLQVPQNPYYK